MNERIDKLFEQLKEEFKAENKYTTIIVPSPLKEKFAQLIVKECSKVIVNGGYRNPALGEKHQLTPPEIAKMIEEHFGVE